MKKSNAKHSDCLKPSEDGTCGKPKEEGNGDKPEASSSDKVSTAVSTVSESTAETQKDCVAKNVEHTVEGAIKVTVKEHKDDEKKQSEDDKDNTDSKPVGRVDRKDVANALLGLNVN